MNALMSIAGFGLAAAGVWVNWGVGYALLVVGVVLFLTGGVAERKGPRP